MSIPDYMTVAELAAKVKLHRKTICHEIREGRLPAIEFGSGYRIDPADVEVWLSSRRVACTTNVEPIPLPRGNTDETAFRQMARQMDRSDGQAQAAPIRHAKAS